MERNKYRKQIHNSVCTPSDDSWGKLNKKLTDYDIDKRNNKQLFMKYAVSMLIIISVGFYFFQPENEITRDEIITSTKENKSPIKSSVVHSEPDHNLLPPTKNSSGIKIMEPKPLANKIINYDSHEKMTITSEDNMEQNENPPTVVHENITSNALNENSKIVRQNVDPDYEVEELLKNANLNIEKNIPFLNITKISAMALLGEIEDDLEKDTRRKLFEKIIITIRNPTEIEITDRSK